MHILIDGTTLSRTTDGLTQYALSIVVEYLKSTSDKYTMICRENELPESYAKRLQSFSDKLAIEFVDIPPIGPLRDFKFRKWYRKNKSRFDCFYEPSAQYPSGIKGGVYTIHDILYEEFPEKLGKFSWLKKLYLHHVVKRGLKKADKVISVSDFTKNEILKYHGKFASDKISVVYEGYEHLDTVKLKPKTEIINIVKDENYFLYIGSSRGHKNLYNLFLAFEKAAVNWNLVVVGRMDRLTENEKLLVEKINKNKEKIIFTGWINDALMYTILSNASAFCFPSKSEGFGIPILEAYYFNVPLLCSNIPVFQEVAGNACIKFNPFDTDDIAKVLKDFIQMSGLEKTQLLQCQRDQLKKYSWHNAAKKIYEILKNQL